MSILLVRMELSQMSKAIDAFSWQATDCSDSAYVVCKKAPK